jgi:hypothetical protein
MQPPNGLRFCCGRHARRRVGRSGVAPAPAGAQTPFPLKRTRPPAASACYAARRSSRAGRAGREGGADRPDPQSGATHGRPPHGLRAVPRWSRVEANESCGHLGSLAYRANPGCSSVPVVPHNGLRFCCGRLAHWRVGRSCVARAPAGAQTLFPLRRTRPPAASACYAARRLGAQAVPGEGAPDRRAPDATHQPPRAKAPHGLRAVHGAHVRTGPVAPEPACPRYHPGLSRLFCRAA